MYSTISEEYKFLYDDDFPNFMNSMVSPDVFDPSTQYRYFPSYLYDEPDNKTFSSILSTLVDPQNNRDMVNANYVTYNRRQYIDLNRTLVLKILEALLIKCTLATKWNYKLRGFFLTTIRIEKDRHMHYMEIMFCVHKPACAFGKVVHIKFVYSAKLDAVKVFECKHIGIIPQQNVDSVVASVETVDIYHRVL